MRIKKTYRSAIKDGKVLNERSTSQDNTYSCDYLNSLILVNKQTINIGTIAGNGNLLNQSVEANNISGYTPMAIGGYKLNSNWYTNIVIPRLYMSGNTIYYDLQNTNPNQQLNTTLEVSVIYVKR